MSELATRDTLIAFLSKHSGEIKDALPKGFDASRLSRIVRTEISKNPELLKCTPISLFGAVIQTAQLGLEPGVLGQAYFVPYGNKVQFMPGYKGLMDLARRSGEVKSIRAHAVKENDSFDYRYGTDKTLNHVPARQNRGKTIAVYAIAKLSNGETEFEVMSLDDVEEVKKRSKAAKSGPWVTDYDEMAKKTVVRRLLKYLPVSVETKTAVAYDEMADAGIDQKTDTLLSDIPHDTPKATTLKDKIAEKAKATTKASVEATVIEPEEPEPEEPEEVSMDDRF